MQRLTSESASELARIARGLVDAGMALSSALTLEQVLQVLVDVARELLQARYAALGVLDASRTGLSDFITSGLTREQRARMGDLPTGHGILGLLITDARTIRLPDLREHASSAGVPAAHPRMRSFLGAPVMARGQVFGNLYVTEKVGGGEFTESDEAIIETLAAQAAVAIENAQLRRARDRFFATTNHELGNALTGIRVWARHLLTNAPESLAEWRSGVRHMLAGAEHATRLVDDVLSLARIQEGRLTLRAEPVDLAAIVNEAAELLQPEIEAGDRRLVVRPPTVQAAIESDAHRVRQILVNLLANAAKFTPSGGSIEVGAAPTRDGGAEFWVSDEGPGIAPENQERIFLPYEQVPREARGRGAGLGLAVSRQLARLMGGDLRVESTPGAGSTFRLTLPATLPVRESD